MAENDEATFNTSQPELLHMLWNLAVCCLSLMRKVICCFLFPFFLYSPVLSLVGGGGTRSRPHLWVLPAASQSAAEVGFLEAPAGVLDVRGPRSVLNRRRLQSSEFLNYNIHEIC